MSYLSRVFIKGLFALLPITLTIFLLLWLATTAEQLFGDPLRRLFPFYFPGAGVILAAILIFFVGLLVNSYLTRKFFEWLEHQVERMPIIKTIYSPLRDVTNLFSRAGGAANQRVVMVPLGPNGIEVMGIVMRDHFEDLPKDTLKSDSVAVFIQLSYGVGGITVLAPRASIREVPIAADKALQLSLTGWVKT
jgi:uncharacterized membrane protein